MICPNCKNQNSDGATSCQFCGAFFTPGGMQPVQPMGNTQPVAPVQPIQPVESSQPASSTVSEVEKPKKKKGLKVALTIFILLLIAGGIGFAIYWFVFRPNNSTVSSDFSFVSYYKNDYGDTTFIDGRFTDKKITDEAGAYEALDTLKDELHFNDVHQEFKVESVEKNAGMTYYKFHQKYQDVDVYASNLIISVDKDGNASSMSGSYIPNISVDTSEQKSQEEAENIVKADLGDDSQIIETNKYIYADHQTAKLVFVVSGVYPDGAKLYFIDANTGEIVLKTDSMQNVSDEIPFDSETVTLERNPDSESNKDTHLLADPARHVYIMNGYAYSRNDYGYIFSMYNDLHPDPIKGYLDNNKFVYSVNSSRSPELSQSGIEALKYFEDIYDYYKNVLGRDSYNNKGSNIVAYVGVHSKNPLIHGDNPWHNACWMYGMNQMYIGYSEVGDVSYSRSKDVLAHEFTHGVIGSIVDLADTPRPEDINKAFEPGILSEAIPDIMGSLIEGKNWQINDSIATMRDLENPETQKGPWKKGGKYYIPDGLEEEGKTLEQFLQEQGKSTLADYDKGASHDNATVPGHAAYLMHKNGAFKSMEEEAKVWYNALFMLPSYATFENCAVAVILSARNLGFSDESIRIIEQAFVETNMLEDRQVEIRGVVTDGDQGLDGVKIELKTSMKLNTNMTFTTANGGHFLEKVNAGAYDITFSKDGYKSVTRSVVIHGNSTINIVLQKSGSDNDDDKLNCNSGNCHKLTIYYVDATNGSNLNEKSETYTVDDGTVLGSDLIVRTVNGTYGSDLIKTDGETFYITVGELKFDFAWYYKDTDTKFNFNQPIIEDVEIEMKMFDGAVDDDIVENVDEFVDDVEDFFDFLKDL